MICAGCGADCGNPERVGRRDRCPRCHGDLRACRQCRFYDRNVAHACREPQAEPVLDATLANFCEYFVVADAPPAAAATPSSSRDALARLFKQR